MDLALLRQVRARDSAFVYGSVALEKVATELTEQDSDNFRELERKTARNRVFRLLDQCHQSDIWRRRQSETDEELTEKEQLLIALPGILLFPQKGSSSEKTKGLAFPMTL